MVAEARNATSAARSATSLATVLKVVLEATEAVDTAAEVAMAADTEAVAHNRLATLAVVTDTCLATAPRARNATTVSPRDQSSSSRLTKTYRRRSRSPQPRLSLGGDVGTCLLQMQAAGTRSGHVPQLRSPDPLETARKILHHRLKFGKSASLSCAIHHPLCIRSPNLFELKGSSIRAPQDTLRKEIFTFHV